MESVLSEERARWKSMKLPRLNLPYFLVHFVLLTVVTLPTIFYIFQPDHPPHFIFNETLPTKNQGMVNPNQTSGQGPPFKCNSPLILDQDSGQCRPPCDWTTQSPSTQKVYYGIVVTGFWLILIATIITFVTWYSIKKLRKFPHVLRFHIMACCILLAFCKMIPIRIGLGKTFCREQLYWQPAGHSSLAVKLQGTTSHFFGLALSFWVMCFIANTYAVLVRERRGVFKHPMKIHFIQSLLCWLGPAIIVAGCLFIAPPGYKFVLVDLLAAGTTSFRMAYFAVTLPMQVTLVVSLSLLWSIIWNLRNARLDATRRLIRAREERVSMRRVERQFVSMAVVMLLLVGVVLSINTVIIYNVRNFIHDSEMYFHCLQTSKNCKSPRYNTVLPLINLVAPGFLCLMFFSLLLTNKDCRQIWKDCFAKCGKMFELCKIPQKKLRAETNRSRSSTMTVLSERRDSEPYATNRIDLFKLVKSKQPLHPYPSHAPSFNVRTKRKRSSTFCLPVTKPKKSFSQRDTVIEILLTPPPTELDGRPRSNSLPVVLSKEICTYFAKVDNKETWSLANQHAADALEYGSGYNSDKNSQAIELDGETVSLANAHAGNALECRLSENSHL